MKHIAITLAAAVATAGVMLASPAGAAPRPVDGPAVLYPLEQLGNLKGTVCLSARPSGGPVSSVKCDASRPGQFFQARPGPRIITGQGLCLTATARKHVWVLPCGRLGQRWWGPVLGLDSKRFHLCVTGPDGRDESVLGPVKLAQCGEFNTAQVWLWVVPPSTAP